MHVKRKQVEYEEVHRQIPAAVTIVVFDMVALGFEGVECLVFDLPPGSSAFDQIHHVVFIHGDIGHPTFSIGDLAFGDQLVLKKIDIVGIYGSVQRHVVDPSVPVPAPFLVGEFQAATVAQSLKLMHPFK